MRKIKTYCLLLAAVVLAACNGINPPFEGTYDQVLIYYGMGYNNLSGNLRTNLLDELKSDVLPGLHREKAIVAFVHNTATSGNYTTPNAPVLMRFYRDASGKGAVDTLKVYDDMAVSASCESIHRVLSDAELKETLIEGEQARLADFATERVEDCFLSWLHDFIA